MKYTNFGAWMIAVTTINPTVHTETTITLRNRLTDSISAHTMHLRDLDFMMSNQMTEKDAEDVEQIRVRGERVVATEVHTLSLEHLNALFSTPTDLLLRSSWKA